jgi:hypothetical protein
MGGQGGKIFFSDVALVTELANQMPRSSVIQLQLLTTVVKKKN